jgi:hypothetical protein
MSVLETPRILFRGSIAWDPITTNNYPAMYDEVTDDPVWPAVTDRVAAYRREAQDAVVGASSWNPDGTHRSTFFNASVTGVDLGAGVRQGDPFVAADVSFQGMLVDLEPYGAFTSQLFFDAIAFGVAGGYRIFCPRLTRFTDRYINFYRNPTNNMIAGVASVVWQTSFPKNGGLRIDALDSPALRALWEALGEPDVLGLTVQFTTYETVYFDDPTLSNNAPAKLEAERALLAKLRMGGFQPNPARSVLVGCVGLWRAGEPPHEPGDRTLLTTGDHSIATAFARVSNDRLTLDLSNSIAETDRQLTKKDLGTLAVVAVSGSTVTALGQLRYADYDKAAYERTCGIVSLPLTAQQANAAATQDLQVRNATGTTLLAEQSVRFIPVTPNRYVDAGTAVAVEFQAYFRGQPMPGKRTVNVFTTDNSGQTVVATTSVTTDETGRASLSIPSPAPGVSGYIPSLSSTPPAGGIDPLVTTYAYLRVLSADTSIGALPATWANVYTYVLADWNALAPCMDNYLRLNDPVQVRAAGATLRKITDPSRFESFLFMPVTRDMTAGERSLLYRFLAEGEPAEGAEGVEATAAGAAHRAPTPAELGGATRRPREMPREP